MSNIDKQWLKQTIAEYEANRDELPFGLDTNSAIELQAFKLALASLEAEPVKRVNADQMHRVCLEANRHLDRYGAMAKEVNKLLGRAAQPAPVSVPDEVLARLEHEANHLTAWHHIDEHSCKVYRRDLLTLVDACRAAMLQGADGNSPVVPDGWVMVPVESTAEMISSGIAAHYERSQIKIHDRPAPGPMECAYVAMLAAAPQQEVKS